MNAEIEIVATRGDESIAAARRLEQFAVASVAHATSRARPPTRARPHARLDEGTNGDSLGRCACG